VGGVGGGVMSPDRAAESKGRQNEYFKRRNVIYCAKKINFRDIIT
jgi:hypothetical protein